MFGDIVGFTPWTSVREPSQVFTLLKQNKTKASTNHMQNNNNPTTNNNRIESCCAASSSSTAPKIMHTTKGSCSPTINNEDQVGNYQAYPQK
jgi:hypothetical protein